MKNLERVLVQNILQGLPQILYGAIQEVPRWELIRYAFPHVLHCSYTLFCEKFKEKLDQSYTRRPLKFDTAETKLLYTLHWILLDAVSECEDALFSARGNDNRSRLVMDLDSLQLFVFLLVPFVDKLLKSDFTTLKLETGLRLWLRLKTRLPLAEGCLSKRMHFGSPQSLPCIAHLKPNMTASMVPPSTPEKPVPAQSLDFSQIQIPIVDCDSADESVMESNFVDYSAPSSFSAVLAPLANLNEVAPGALNQPQHSVTSTLSPRLDDELSEVSCNSIPHRSVHSVLAFLARKLSVEARDPESVFGTMLDVSVVRCLYHTEWAENGVYWASDYLLYRLVVINQLYSLFRQAREEERAKRWLRPEERETGQTSRSNSMPQLKFSVTSAKEEGGEEDEEEEEEGRAAEREVQSGSGEFGGA
ncbi:Protein unc-80 [Cichlidogyrus casuarinus]|uniref:Protein unc-80 n=1 Tax=Cichlidogyrus casuarinus TaxID=1844966 RepID=A0ABD2QEK4_9PLAT